MESKNRNVWIIVIGALVIVCCCALALIVGAVGWLASSRSAYVEVEPWIPDVAPGLDSSGRYEEEADEGFSLGNAPSLEVTNFAGSVTVRAGTEDFVRVVAIKKASTRSRLDQIEVSMSPGEESLVVKTTKDFTSGNASVDLEITAPPSSRVKVDTGAGVVEVRDIQGAIDLRSGAGTVDVRGAQGPTHIDLGAGTITYEGAPQGDCRFQTGVGEIVLLLPDEPDVRIDLGTGLGSVNVEFAVEGHVSMRSADGLIGDGSRGSVYAQSGAGGIRVERR